jgi:putative GTP pyrophosphokinase
MQSSGTLQLGLYSSLSNESIITKFNDIDDRIRVTDRLAHLNVARNTIRKMDSGVVLRFSNNGNLTVHPVPRFQKAMEFYFNIEKSHPDDDVVLVNSSEERHIRSAYRNYFSDTSEFLEFLETGKNALMQQAQEPG